MHQSMLQYGAIRSVSMQYNTMTNEFRGSAVVEFAHHDGAQQAIESFSQSGTVMNGKRIGMKWHEPGALRDVHLQRQKPRSGPGHQIFLKNLYLSTSENQLAEACSSFGEVVRLQILRDSDALSRGMARVRFANKEDAEAAIQGLNGTSFDGRELVVHMDAMYESTGDVVPEQHVSNDAPESTSAYGNTAGVGSTAYNGVAPNADFESVGIDANESFSAGAGADADAADDTNIASSAVSPDAAAGASGSVESQPQV